MEKRKQINSVFEEECSVFARPWPRSSPSRNNLCSLCISHDFYSPLEWSLTMLDFYSLIPWNQVKQTPALEPSPARVPQCISTLSIWNYSFSTYWQTGLLMHFHPCRTIWNYSFPAHRPTELLSNVVLNEFLIVSCEPLHEKWKVHWQSKRHHQKLVVPIMSAKCRFSNIYRVYRYLMVSKGQIPFWNIFCSGQLM